MRDRRMHVLLSDEEDAALAQLAKELGLSKGGTLRSLMNEACKAAAKRTEETNPAVT